MAGTGRAKFIVQSLGHFLGNVPVVKDGKPTNEYKPGKLTSVKLTAVYHQGDFSHENAKWWSATPQGTIDMQMVFPEAAALFEIGDEFLVDFTKAHRTPSPEEIATLDAVMASDS
jgi:hypothetical protein